MELGELPSATVNAAYETAALFIRPVANIGRRAVNNARVILCPQAYLQDITGQDTTLYLHEANEVARVAENHGNEETLAAELKRMAKIHADCFLWHDTRGDYHMVTESAIGLRDCLASPAGIKLEELGLEETHIELMRPYLGLPDTPEQ